MGLYKPLQREYHTETAGDSSMPRPDLCNTANKEFHLPVNIQQLTHWNMSGIQIWATRASSHLLTSSSPQKLIDQL